MKNSKNCWTVYCHTTPSGKRYIGITSQKPEKRWSNGRGYDSETPFGCAIEKYKWENIKHEILDTDLDEFTAKCLEEYYIFSYQTYVGFKDCKGYNCTLGGEGCVGHKTSEETKQKQSEANKGKNKGKTSWSKGKHLSEEHKRKIGESNKGRTPWKGKHHTKEEKKRISTSLIGHQSPIKGKHFSEEHKRKISESQKGKNKGKHWKLIDGKRFYYE